MAVKGYPMPPKKPTERMGEGELKIDYDFNDGARIYIHKFAREKQPTFTVIMRDDARNFVIFAKKGVEAGTMLVSNKKYYIPFVLQVIEEYGKETIWETFIDFRGRNVMVCFPVGTLGDSIAWMASALRFCRTHEEAKLITLVLSDTAKTMFTDLRVKLPSNTTILSMSEYERDKKDINRKWPPYATYNLGLFTEDDENDTRPIAYQKTGLIGVADSILGGDPDFSLTTPYPEVSVSVGKVPFKRPYAAIAVQASAPMKCWLNPNGWIQVVKHLNSLGLDAVCIDREPATGHGPVTVQIPNGAIDMTGDMPLAERAAVIARAKMFIGVSSGLAWLAWMVQKNIVLISGFTEPFNEFPGCASVMNKMVCHGCWNDTRFKFDVDDPLWCPLHKGTERHLECSRCISASQVIRAIDNCMAGNPCEKPGLGYW